MPKNTWICALCVDEESMPMEFESDQEYINHNKKFHLNMAEDEKRAVERPVGKTIDIGTQPTELIKEPVVEKEAEKEKIRLTYKYGGQCPVCGKLVDTIEVDVGEKVKEHFCIAWCNACKNNLLQRKVVRL